MADNRSWAQGFGRQAAADFRTFEVLGKQDAPECHKMHFLQMACEKLAKAHLCETKTPLDNVQASHAYIAKTLPIVLKQQAIAVNFSGPAAKTVQAKAKHLAREIELLSPSVTDGGKRPDNCEYPWEDETGTLHSPLEWPFNPSHLLLAPSGRSVLKLLRGAVERWALENDTASQ